MKLPVVHARLQIGQDNVENPQPIFHLIITHKADIYSIRVCTNTDTRMHTRAHAISCFGLISGRNNYCNRVISTYEQIRSQTSPTTPPPLSLTSPHTHAHTHTHTHNRTNTEQEKAPFSTDVHHYFHTKMSA